MCAKTIKWTSIVFHVIIFVLIDAETYYTKKIKGEVSGITFSVADRPILYLFGDSITQYSSKVRPSWVSGIWSVLLISNVMLVIAAPCLYFFSKLDVLTSIFFRVWHQTAPWREHSVSPFDTTLQADPLGWGILLADSYTASCRSADIVNRGFSGSAHPPAHLTPAADLANQRLASG